MLRSFVFVAVVGLAGCASQKTPPPPSDPATANV